MPHHSSKQKRSAGRFASAKPKAEKPPMVNINVIGAAREEGGFRGIADGEVYNPELSGVEGYKVMDRMSASDPTVSAVLRAHYSPIQAAEWFVEPANDDDSRAIDAADLCREQLFGMDDDWGQFVGEALEFSTFGFYSFEKLWEMSEGQARLRLLAPRPPIELTDVVSDRDGMFLGVVQHLSQQATADMPEGFPVDRMQTKSTGDVWIPAEKLCHLVRNRRGGNFTGRSILRPVYKPWYIKTNLEMIAGIAIERRSMGVDTMTPPKGATPDQKNAAETAMMGLHSREMQYLVIPEGWEYSLEGLRGGVIGPEKFLEYCDIGIARGAGAEFIMMGGQGASGSLSQHVDKTSLFMAGLLALPNAIRQAIDCQVIPDIVRFNIDPNFPPELMPKLTISRLDSRNLKDLAAAAVQLDSSRLLGEVTDDDRNVFRKMLEISELEPRDEEPGPEPEPKPIKIPDDGLDDDSDPTTLASWLAARQDRIEQLPRSDFPVTQFMDADLINDALDTTQAAIMASAREHQRHQVSAMVEFASLRWAKGDKRGILKPKVPFQAEVAEAFGTHLFKLSEQGREMVASEASLQAEAGGIKRKFAIAPVNAKSTTAARQYLLSRGKSMSTKLANQLHSAYQFSILPMVRDGTFDAAVLQGKLDELALRDVATAARLSVSEALSLGRKAQQEEFEAAGDVEYYVYSTATESDTCGPCAALEGARIEAGSDDFQRFYPPLRDGPLGPCEGADGCNCDIFAVFDTSEPGLN